MFSLCSEVTFNAKVAKIVPKSKLSSEDIYKHGLESFKSIDRNMIDPIIEEVINGSNGLIVLDGVTSENKRSFLHGSKDYPGVIESSINKIFNVAKKFTSNIYLFHESYVEIYDERITNLFSNDLNSSDVQKVVVTDPTDAISLYRNSETWRFTRERHSNIHTLFQFTVESMSSTDFMLPKANKPVQSSTLFILELSGAEELFSYPGNRFNRPHSSEDNRNKSSECLYKILSKLSQGRSAKDLMNNSVLTHLLEDPLNNGSHCAFICTVAVTNDDVGSKALAKAIEFIHLIRKIKLKIHKNEICFEDSHLSDPRYGLRTYVHSLTHAFIHLYYVQHTIIRIYVHTCFSNIKIHLICVFCICIPH